MSKKTYVAKFAQWIGQGTRGMKVLGVRPLHGKYTEPKDAPAETPKDAGTFFLRLRGPAKSSPPVRNAPLVAFKSHGRGIVPTIT